MAGSLFDLIENGKYKYGLPILVVKKITKQILQGLLAVHNKLNLVHTDIKPENILLTGINNQCQTIIDQFESTGFTKDYDKYIKNKNFDELNTFALNAITRMNEMYSFSGSENSDGSCGSRGSNGSYCSYGTNGSRGSYGSRGSHRSYGSYDDDRLNKRKQSVDDYIEYMNVMPLQQLENDYDFKTVLNNKLNSKDHREIVPDKFILDPDIKISDFGNSLEFHDRNCDEIQTRNFRAPEVILNYTWTENCDIWSVACTVFELLTGELLFKPIEEHCNLDANHLFLIEKFVGKIPKEIIIKSKRGKILYDPNRQWHLRHIDTIQPLSLEKRLKDQHLFDSDNAKQISDFLLLLLNPDMSKRVGCADCLKHPWLIF
jgi:serine/threonine protein kinase